MKWSVGSFRLFKRSLVETILLRSPLQFRWLFMGCWLIALMLSTSCDVNQGQAQTNLPQITQEDLPSRFELRKKIRESRQLTVIYGTRIPSHAQAYQNWLTDPKNHIPWLTLNVLADTAIEDTAWFQDNVVLLGTPTDHQVLTSLLPTLPFRIGNTGFEFEQETYADSTYSFTLGLYPNPLNPEAPLSVMTGNSLSAILGRLNGPRSTNWSNPLLSSWGYEIREGERMIKTGHFDDQWQIDPQRVWEFESADGPTLSTVHYELYTHGLDLPANTIQALADELEGRFERIKASVGKPIESGPIPYHLYGHAELMGLMTRRMEQAFVDWEDGSVHRIYHPAYLHCEVGAEHAWWLRQALGKPRIDALEEGWGICFTDNWQKMGHAYWSISLANSHNHIPLAALLDNEYFQAESKLVRGAMAASLIGFLLEKWNGNNGTFLAQYTNWNPTTKEIQAMEPEWEAYLAGLRSTELLLPKKDSLGYLRGMTLAHEGYQIYNGYASQEAQRALTTIQDVYANSIAIVPYTGTRNTTSPAVYPIWQSAGSENDVSVVFAQYHARELGMTSLLKPQIWFSRGWPGDVKMSSEEDWKAFFKEYRRWIRHYAMLAAIHESDAFCVGVEFVNATLGYPEVWRQLVEDLRHIYPGPITYAANWGAEAEQIAFADALDFIGVNCYYPLSELETPTDAQLERGAATIMDKLNGIYQRAHKPIVLTEVGFRSVDGCWINPHAEAKGRDYNAEAQARSYQVMLKALDGQSWCRGMYWWKWPSYLGYVHETPNSFTACGKPAEKVLKNWYKRWSTLE